MGYIYKILILMSGLIFSSCITTSSVAPEKNMRNPISAVPFFYEQEEAVNSFIASGTLSYGKKMRTDEGSFFAVGTLNPLKLKLEITHPWGGDIMHVLFDQNNITVVSFRDKAIYKGEYTELTQINSLILADPLIVWSFFRGFPRLLPYEDSYTEGNNKFFLLGSNSFLKQSVSLEEGRMIPLSTEYNSIGIIVDTDDFTNIGDIFYALAIKIASKNTDEFIDIRFKGHEFNRSITQGIFNIFVPPGFQVLPFHMDLQ